MPPALPPEDRRRSPYTGWTRAHWTAVADTMLDAVAPYRSPQCAFVDLPGTPSSSGARSDGLEGFARTLLMAGFRAAGEAGARAEVLEPYARGLAAGTDPRSPEAWPRPDELGQAKVEAASIALVLQLTRPWLWDQLDQQVQERTIDWLAGVIGQPYPPINWVWFRIVVESFLREAGGPWSFADIEQDLAVHASLRRPGGWLSDGQERAYDHYTGWALHLYPLLWTHLFDVRGTLCPEPLLQQWRDDLSRYLDDAIRLIGADGSPLMQGRSLIYRFAAAGPLWVGAITDAGSLAPGLVRRAASGMLRHFTEAGSLEPDGLLRLGWTGPWPQMAQSYSGPGSPYWAAKGMLGLMLPEEHPVWQLPEQPLPIEQGDVARTITAPGWLVSARKDEGTVLVINHGTDHAVPGATCADSPLYARLGYSTATIPPLTGPTGADPLDNSVTVLDEAGRATHRSGFETLFVQELPGGVLAGASRSRVRWVDSSQDTTPDHGSGRSGAVVEGPDVTVASIVHDGLEVRLVRLDAPGGADAAWKEVRLGGWPLADDEDPSTDDQHAVGEERIAAHAEVAGGRLLSRVRALRGFNRAGTTREQGTSPLARWTSVPWLAAQPPPVGQVLAASVFLGARAGGAADPTVSVGARADGSHRVEVRWATGERTAAVLPAPPITTRTSGR